MAMQGCESLIAAVISRDGGAITANQSGWTLLLGDTANEPGIAVYWREVVGGEASSYSWAVPGYDHGVVLAECSEMDVADLLEASAVTRTYSDNATDATLTAAAILAFIIRCTV